MTAVLPDLNETPERDEYWSDMLKIAIRIDDKADVLKGRVMEARRAYRATLDATGRGSAELYRAMEAAEAEWDGRA